MCIHPVIGGNLKGRIPEIVNGMQNPATGFDSFWVRVNAGGGSAIMYPCKNRKQTETILTISEDLTEKNPGYLEYSYMGNLIPEIQQV